MNYFNVIIVIINCDLCSEMCECDWLKFMTLKIRVVSNHKHAKISVSWKKYPAMVLNNTVHGFSQSIL